jgi:hypothetical protein
MPNGKQRSTDEVFIIDAGTLEANSDVAWRDVGLCESLGRCPSRNRKRKDLIVSQVPRTKVEAASTGWSYGMEL